jgi:hypothetical protein
LSCCPTPLLEKPHFNSSNNDFGREDSLEFSLSFVSTCLLSSLLPQQSLIEEIGSENSLDLFSGMLSHEGVYILCIVMPLERLLGGWTLHLLWEGFWLHWTVLDLEHDLID